MKQRRLNITLNHSTINVCMVGRVCINNEVLTIACDYIAMASTYSCVITDKVINITLFFTNPEHRLVQIDPLIIL